MQKYLNGARTLRGDAIKNASITVRNLAGTLATLYSDNGVTPQANPIITGRDGEYMFYAANGRYSISITANGFVGESVSDVLLYDPSEAYTPIDPVIANSAASAFASAVLTAADRVQTGLDRTAASDSAAAALASKNTASDKAAEALASLNDFKGRWYGALSADPALDPLGAAVGVGDAYFNSASNLLKIYNGATWQASDINTANLAAAGGAGLVGIVAPGVGAVASTVASELGKQSTKVWGYGAVGDGVADDTVALQKALTACPDGGTVELEPGKVYRTSALLWSAKAHEINGNGATIKPDALTVAQGSSVITMGKQLSSHTGFAPFSFVSGASKITLPAGVTATVGDLLLLQSTDVYVAVAGGTDYPHGMFAVVTSVAGQVVGLSCAAYATFTVLSIIKYQGAPKLKISGVVFDLSSHPNTYGVYGALAMIGTNITVSDCRIIGNAYAGEGIAVSGENAIVERNTVSGFLNTQGLPLPGRLGYGVNVGANNTVVRDCVLTNNKHGVTGGSRVAVIRNTAIVHNQITEDITLAAGTFAGSIDMHCGHTGRLIVSDNAVAGYSALINVRNKTASITRNTLLQLGAAGNIINTVEQGFDGLYVASNRILAYGAYSNLLGSYQGTTSYLSLKNIEVCSNYQSQGKVFRVSAANTVAENINIHHNTLVSMDAVLQVSDETSITASGISVNDNAVAGVGALVTMTAPGMVIAGLKSNRNTVRDGKTLCAISPASDTVTASGIELHGNDFTQLAGAFADYGLILDGVYGTVTSTFSDVSVKDNKIDISGNTSTAYAAEIGNGTYTRLNVCGNELLSPAGSFRGISFGNGTLSKFKFSGNSLNGNLLWKTPVAASISSDINITGNTVGAIDIASGTGAMTLNGFAIDSNKVDTSLSMTETTGALTLSNGAIRNNRVYAAIAITSSNDASTTWQGAGTELLMSGNVTETDTLYVKFNYNRVVAIGNRLYKKIQDSSVLGAYYTTPRNNKITIAPQITWKGGMTVSTAGDLLGAAAPGSGAWEVGDRVAKSVPAVGSPKAWICTVAGTPGTWVSEGNL